jgi:uncharacterized RDD family membrane protein YckC
VIDSDPTAVMGRRILAWVLDLLLFAGVVLGVFAALAAPVDIPEGFVLDACERLQAMDSDEASGCIEVGDTAYITSTADTGIQTLTTFGYFAFFVVLQGMTGASPGKLVTGLRVVDEQGGRAGVGRSLLRTLLWVVDGAPWFLPLVGFITGLTSTGHRRVGDLAAKTYVVSRGSVGAPPLQPAAEAYGTPTWSPPAATGAPWEAPTPAPAPPPAGPPTAPAPDLPPPQWDQARGTYIQWEPGPRRWLQWDAVHQRWEPIDS